MSQLSVTILEKRRKIPGLSRLEPKIPKEPTIALNPNEKNLLRAARGSHREAVFGPPTSNIQNPTSVFSRLRLF